MIKRALILVEGQTEERFVKDVLAPHLQPLALYISATRLVTKVVRSGSSFRGGVTSYRKFKNDLKRLLHDSGGCLVTTLIDYYGLPLDFPGMASRPARGTPLERAEHVEREIAADLGSPRNLLPFLALHEFEAWLFSSADVLPATMGAQDRTNEFAAIRDAFANPEEINDGETTAPSKRITALFRGYRKSVHGPLVAGRIGLEAIRSQCPHANEWIESLEQYAAG